MAALARIEYVRLRRGGDQGALSPSIIALNGGAAEILVVGAASVQSAAAPSFPDGVWNSGVYVRITALSGAVAAEVGLNPEADIAGGTLVRAGRAGDEVFLPIEAGQKVALIEVTIATGQRPTAVETAVPAVTAVAYATGQVLGGKMTFTNMADVAGATGLLQTVSAACKTSQTAAIDLLLFNDDPVTNFVNAAALNLAAADFDKVIDVVPITLASLGVASFGRADGRAAFYKLASTSMFAVAVARGAMTLGSTTDLKFTIGAGPD